MMSLKGLEINLRKDGPINIISLKISKILIFFL